MTQALEKTRSTEVGSPWMWKSADGDFHLPSEMETRHLFFTLRMIWNHSVPERMKVGHNVRMYRFGAFYTQKYMQRAILSCGRELFQRKDIKPEWWKELMEMASYYRSDEYRSDEYREVFAITGPRLMLEHDHVTH